MDQVTADSIAQRLAGLDITITRTCGDTVRLRDDWMGPLGSFRVGDVARALEAVSVCGDSASVAQKYSVFHGSLSTR